MQSYGRKTHVTHHIVPMASRGMSRIDKILLGIVGAIGLIGLLLYFIG